MNQLKAMFNSFTLQQKITIGIAAVMAIAAIYIFVGWHHEQDFKPLYTGIAPEDAGAVIQKIKESGSEYRLSESGTIISVPSSKVAELRLELAAAGLPKTGRIGFEIFDKNNFGVTDFVEHVNYNRALEGELERSVNSLAAIESSRVHITPAKDSVFIDSREPGKASVVVRLRGGMTLFPPNVAAIQQLVSSAVDGVNPDDVSVVDTRGTLLSRRKTAADDATDAAYTLRERLEHDMVAKINGTLEPLLGRDRFHADVAVECDLTTSEQDEDTLDPAKSVMTSSQKTEEVTAGGSTAGIPGTASNLPRPPARNGGPTNSTTRRSENTTFESSRIVRKTHIPQGQIKRVTVAVLLDQKMHWEGTGKARKLVPTPMSADTIKAVHDLVAGVTGFSQERGDQITVESLPFESTQAEDLGTGTNTAPAKPFNWKNWKEYLHNPVAIAAAGGAVTMLVVFGALFFLFSRRKSKAAALETAAALPAAGGAVQKAVTLPAGSAPAPASGLTAEQMLDEAKAKAALNGANMAEQMEAALAERMAEQQKADLMALASLKLPVSTKKTDLLTKEIREQTKKDPAIPAHVLQTWIQEDRK